MAVKGKEMQAPVKIGLEIHGYLDTYEKLFCKCSTALIDKANSQICPRCTGMPGSKPMLPNAEAMKKLIQISLILGCKINHDKKLIWQRKHYDWPDLPKGFQNTISGAYSVPCAIEGRFLGVKIRETHLEEDPSRWNPDSGKVDYNRSGLSLVEIVTEPDFSNPEEVVSWLKDLILILSYIKAIRKNLGIKVDVNISTYGERAEIKNLNSLSNIKNALDYEIARQLENHAKGILQKQETLSYDAKLGKTVLMRTKEQAEDYRFIPEPDLPVILLDVKEIKKIEKALPETPQVKLDNLLKKHKIDKKNADILMKNLELVEFFESLSKEVDAKKYISWITIELLRILHYNKKELGDDDVDIKPEHLAELIKAVDKKQVSVLKAKQVMNDFIPKSFSILEKKDISQVSEFGEVEKWCKQVIEKNKSVVEDYKSGRKEAINFLIGQVMGLSERRADFQVVRKCLQDLI